METVDVAIIGAGPAGSAAAIGLAQRGYEVALIDKKLFPREKPCGDFVNPINWPVFRELGVEDRVLAQPHAEVTGFRITTAAGHDAAAQFTSAGQDRAIGLGIRRAWLADRMCRGKLARQDFDRRRWAKFLGRAAAGDERHRFDRRACDWLSNPLAIVQTCNNSKEKRK
jgi:2-polyprenyl-6-methoxyphenol hydroxylase-like FAD-dependent oxidoreductase